MDGNHIRCVHTENGYFCDDFCELDHLMALSERRLGPLKF